MPSKSAPAGYTRHFVSNAIARYEAQGLEATEAGVWVESESLRVFVAGTDGYAFGSGWHGAESGN